MRNWQFAIFRGRVSAVRIKTVIRTATVKEKVDFDVKNITKMYV
jgi:hypothetical protein